VEELRLPLGKNDYDNDDYLFENFFSLDFYSIVSKQIVLNYYTSF